MKSLKTPETSNKKNDYWFETAKRDFSAELNRLFKDSGMTRVDLANKIDSSPAYITKVFRGNINFTLRSMIKLVGALGGELHIKITPKKSKTHFVEVDETTDIDA